MVSSTGFVGATAQAASPAVGDGAAVGRDGEVGGFPIESHGGTPDGFALGGEAALGFAAGGGTAGLFAADFGLAGGDPGGFAGLDAPAAAVGDGVVAQVDEVEPEQAAGDREADPEAGSDRDDADQFDGVEQDEGGEDAAAADDGGGAAALRGAALRAFAGDEPESAFGRRGITLWGGDRNRDLAGGVDRSASGHGAATAPAL